MFHWGSEGSGEGGQGIFIQVLALQWQHGRRFTLVHYSVKKQARSLGHRPQFPQLTRKSQNGLSYLQPWTFRFVFKAEAASTGPTPGVELCDHAAITATVGHLPAASWTRPEACLCEQPGDTWGKALQPPHHSQANLSRRQAPAPGGREAHLEQTEHGPPAQETSPRWARTTPGPWRKPCQAEQQDRAARVCFPRPGSVCGALAGYKSSDSTHREKGPLVGEVAQVPPQGRLPCSKPGQRLGSSGPPQPCTLTDTASVF